MAANASHGDLCDDFPGKKTAPGLQCTLVLGKMKPPKKENLNMKIMICVSMRTMLNTSWPTIEMYCTFSLTAVSCKFCQYL